MTVLGALPAVLQTRMYFDSADYQLKRQANPAIADDRRTVEATNSAEELSTPFQLPIMYTHWTALVVERKQSPTSNINQRCCLLEQCKDGIEYLHQQQCLGTQPLYKAQQPSRLRDAVQQGTAGDC
jgi:hypothetical protein